MRDEYLKAIKNQLDEKIFTHSLALESCMGGLYDYFQSQGRLTSEDGSKDDWLIAGLVHDIDYSEPYKADHPNKTIEALARYNLTISDTVLNIIKAHSPSNTGVQPKTKAQWSLYCADSLTGLIMAVAYVYPSKKLADVKVSSVLKRFLKEPKFAAGTRRDEVAECQNPDGLNISVEKLIEICLASMQAIAPSLGL